MEKECGRSQSWQDTTCYNNKCLDGLRRTMKTLNQNSNYVFRPSLQQRNCEYKSDTLPFGICTDVHADIPGVPRRDDRISEACFKDHMEQQFLINYSKCILTYIPVYFTSLRMN
jgi:hypothetical protein